MSQNKHAIKNGEIIEEANAVVNVTLPPVQSNFSVYEALRVLKRHVVHLDDHTKRLEKSALSINLPLPKVDWMSEINKLIEKDNIEDASIRILVVGTETPTWFITWTKLLTYPDSYYKEGVDVITYEGERLLPQSKTGNLLINFLSREEAKRNNAFEALLIDRNGQILEGSRSNFYLIMGDTIKTAPDEKVLDGITRISVLRAGRELGYKIDFTSPFPREIWTSDAVFISSTSMGAMPIRSVDGKECPFDSEKVAAICSLVRKWELE